MNTNPLFLSIKNALHQLIWGYSKWLIATTLILYTLSGTYKIDGDSIGVLLSFGKIIDQHVEPGLHYKLPWPFNEIQIIKLKQIKTLVISDFGSQYNSVGGDRASDFYNETGLEPYCITGDNNIVAITMVLKYTIGDPVKYLYSMKQPEQFMERATAQLVMTHLASIKIDEALTFGKKQLELDVRRAMSQQLEKLQTGINISFLEIKELQPTDNVQPYFNKVINAEVARKEELHMAEGYMNRVVPQARTKADEIIQDALAYKSEKILTTEGETARILSRLKEYKKNPQAHEAKIKLDFIKNLYPQLKEIRVVNQQDQVNKTIILPINR